jgi:hypothetical protein
MISSLLRTTVRYTAGGIRLATRPGVWLTRTIVSTVFSSGQEDSTAEARTSESEAAPAKRSSQSVSGTRRPTGARRPADARGDRPTGARAAKPGVTRRKAKPGVPGRDAVPARPADPHHELNTPVGEPDPTEWPDPYDQRPDPLDPDPGNDEGALAGNTPHTPTGATSTSAPHPSQDPEAGEWEGPKRDKLDR